MHWFWRAALAFVIVLLLWLTSHCLAWSLLKWSSDVELADAVAGLPAWFLFFVLYQYLPTLLRKQNPPDFYRERSKFFSGWWWKWLCLGFSSISTCVNDIAGTVFGWELHNRIWPGAEGGFPSAMDPQIRAVWIDVRLNWHLSIPANVFAWIALFLFWRDWRRPRQPQGLCRYCGYDLTGNMSGVCPECGEKVEEESFQRSAISRKGLGVAEPPRRRLRRAQAREGAQKES